jgi:hypothetical protein
MGKNKKQNKDAEKTLNDRNWTVITRPSYTWINRPNQYNSKEYWRKWAKTQISIISKVQLKLTHTYMYIRYSTYFPKQYVNELKSCHGEILSKKCMRDTVLVFPECQDQSIWEKILLGDSFSHNAQSFYVLENNPSNWREVITKTHRIIYKIHDLNTLNVHNIHFSPCRCIFSVEDSNLLVVKIDLSEKILNSILEEEAENEKLELLIEKEH